MRGGLHVKPPPMQIPHLRKYSIKCLHLAIPSAADPPSWGAGHRPVRHVKRTLTHVRDAGGLGGGLLGSPGSTAGGMGPAQPPMDRDPPADPRPSRSRCAPAGGAVTATGPPPRTAVADPACPSLRRADRARCPAGCRPTNTNHPRHHRQRRPPGIPLSAPAAGRSAWPESERQRSDGLAPRRRRVRPVSGRLEDVQSRSRSIPTRRVE